MRLRGLVALARVGSEALASGCVAGGGDGAGVIASRRCRHGVCAAHASGVWIDGLSAHSLASTCYAAVGSYRRRRWAHLAELLQLVVNLRRAA
jgi:hypothetical protein